ncbi:TIGR00266 family protein [Rhodocyclus tenuis]|uniref:TIGR00266 family protein n=1 Tax=Rhodocyclus tenuis TaxID=1066 RepID=A0A6L5JZC9_RHOTE|nr:TIGR00266 family protein [Rhodocyclus gracilis]MQY52677.1 TIGR00266 family protein [Rhodocyclus gracilis]MRD73369.1 TIGR00266 family protein [Rhodocyclus gracilis]
MAMDVVDYEIFGHEMQYVEVELDPGEAAVGEAGAMMYMQDGIQMDTVFGDGSAPTGGLFGKLLGAGKRLVTGEGLFTTIFVNDGAGKRRVAFAAPYPGKIVPVNLGEIGGTLICQKDAFLCAAKGVSLGIAFQKKLGVGFFGGEGFVMQKLDGDGMAFVHAGGTLMERTLAPGERLRVDTGCVVAFQPTVDFDIQYVGKIKSAIFGGEGLFFATLSGPGKVWLQSLPLSRLANRIVMSAPVAGGRSAEQGSLLGAGMLGGLLGGDDD